MAVNSTGSQPNASAILDVSSTTKGLLIPRMTSTQRNAIVAPATGLQVYQTDGSKGIYFYNGSVWMPVATAGTTYTAGTGIVISGTTLSAKNTTALWNANQLQGKNISTTTPLNGQVLQYDLASSKWIPATLSTAAGGSGWSLKGNAATKPGNFIGTTDAQPFVGRANGKQVFRFSPSTSSTMLGYQAGNTDTTGGDKNHFIGYQAGFSNTSFNNHFDGFQAGYNNTSGYSNQFIGFQAGYKNTKGTNNTFIGTLAGYNSTTANGSHFIGAGAGFSNTTGTDNHFNGYDAGQSNTTGSNNYFEGNHAGFANTTGSNNHLAGNNAGYSNLTGNDNFFEGNNAGYNSTTGHNQFSGNNAGKSNTTGYTNLFVGNSAGFSNTTGGFNSFVGMDAGYNNVTGNGNVFVGGSAGKNNILGSSNVFLGNSAGYNEPGSNKLYISNSMTTSPLIYGEFDNEVIKINGTQEIHSTNSTVPVLTLKGYTSDNVVLKFAFPTNPNHNWAIIAEPYNDGSMYFNHDGIFTTRLESNGDITTIGTVYASSDKTLKKNINPLNNSLQKLLRLGSYTYNWIDSIRSKEEQIGFLAQEVETQFPQLVKTDKSGIKSVAYGNMVPVLVASIREQQTMIDDLRIENVQLKKDIIAIKSKLGL